MSDTIETIAQTPTTPVETVAAPAAVEIPAGLGTPEADTAPAEPVTEQTPEQIAEAEAAAAVAAQATKDAEVPEAYELTAPEGIPLDADMVALATPTFKELGLTTASANKLMPLAGEFAQRVADNTIKSITDQHQARVAEWATQAVSDPEIGGDPQKYAANVVLAAQALDRIGFPAGSPFRVFLDESGLGNNPEMIRAFVRVGSLVSEDTVFPRSGGLAPAKLDMAQSLYPNDKPTK